MDIKMNRDGDKLEMVIAGKIDTITSPELESKVSELEGVTDLVINLLDVDYISSSGLRVLIIMQNVMDDQGSMTVRYVSDSVMEIFEATGLADLFDID